MRALKKSLWPSTITVENTKVDLLQAELWLDKNIGKFRDKWFYVDRYSETKYYFKQEKDAVLFSLRWS